MLVRDEPEVGWQRTDLTDVKLVIAIRWQSRRTCAHLLREQHNWNLSLNNHQQDNVGSHQKRYTTHRGKREGPTRWFSSVQSLSRVRLFSTLQIAARQASLSIANSQSSLRLRPSSQWCHPAISSSVIPLSSCPQSLPAWGSFPMSWLFASVAKVLEFQPQHQSFQWTPRTGLL